MKLNNFCLLACFLAGSLLSSSISAQPYSLTREEMIMYTPMWKGERFPDGRPKVSDNIIERMKHVSITEAWGSLRGMTDSQAALGTGSSGSGYTNQYYGGFKRLHDDITICGRAATIQFMPFRPDVANVLREQGEKDGRARAHGTWLIDQLQKGDVYVANVCEGILDASHVGDNLGTTIWTRTGNGAIIRGTLRDTEGNMKLDGFNVFVRDFRPESNSSNMTIGINGPIQIGYVTVMPGDVVLAKFEGVIFIPPHLAENVVVASEKARLRDTWAHAKVKAGLITAAQADGGYTEAMNREFNEWLRTNADNIAKFFEYPEEAPSPEFVRAYLKERELNPPKPR
jgi:4-hydroxy-4-methyl-2-oxoglutarate aldolase